MKKRWAPVLALILMIFMPLRAQCSINVKLEAIDAYVTLPSGFTMVYQSMSDMTISLNGQNAEELKGRLKAEGIECVGENTAGNVQFVIYEPEYDGSNVLDYPEDERKDICEGVEKLYLEGGYDTASASYVQTPYTSLIRVEATIAMRNSTKHLLQYMYGHEGISLLIQAEKKNKAFSAMEAALFDAIAQTVQFGGKLNAYYTVYSDRYTCKESGVTVPVHALWYSESDGVFRPLDDSEGAALYYEWFDLYEAARANGWTGKSREKVLAQAAGMSAMEYSEEMIRAMTADYVDPESALIYEYDFAGTKFMVSDFDIPHGSGRGACPVKLYIRTNENDAMMHCFTFIGSGKDTDKEYIYDVTSMLDGTVFALEGAPDTEAARILRKSKTMPLFDENGLSVVKPQFFQSGLVSVDGRIVADAEWTNIHSASDTLYLLDSEEYDCYVDTQGQVLGGERWDTANLFSEGLANVRKNRKDRYIDEQGNVVFESDAKYAHFCTEGLIDFCGQNGKHGYMDKQGNVVIEPAWDDAFSFREDAARVFSGSVNTLGMAEKGLYGFIDKQGSVISEPQWEVAENFSEGRAVVCKGGLYGCIDKQGNVVVEPKWASMGNYSQGLARVNDGERKGTYMEPVGGKYSFIDLDGELVIDCSAWDYVTDFGDDEYATIFVGALNTWGRPDQGKYGLINTKGEVLLAPEWEKALSVRDGKVIVQKDGKYGMVTVTGKTVLGFEYEELSHEKEGLYCAKKNGKYGYIDSKGKTVIGFTWEEAGPFRFGYASVMLNGSWYVIDKTGKIVL